MPTLVNCRRFSSTAFLHRSHPRTISTGFHALKGRSAVITGASRGIGFAIAQRFAQEGIKCLLVGRQKSALEEAARKVRSVYERPGDTDISCMVADVTHEDAWKSVAQGQTPASQGTFSDAVDWLSRHPHPDILVNAAGISQNSLLLRTSPAHLETVVQTNLQSPMLACREVGKQMVRAKRDHSGCIINISSLLAWQGGRGSAAYSASKAGLLGLTRALAAELGPLNVRVNAIVPGYVETTMISGLTPNAKEALLKKIPLGRFALPEEVAQAAVFLVANEYANNCVVNLDGGLSAHS